MYLLCVYIVVVPVVGVCLCASVTSCFLSLLVFWWLYMCLRISGFRLLCGASGLGSEVCVVFVCWRRLLGCVCFL